MNQKGLVYWGYLSEIVLATLCLVIVFTIFESLEIVSFIRNSAVDFAAYFSGIMLAGSIAFYCVFYSKSDTPFSSWLYEKGAYRIYEKMFIFAICLYSILTLALVVTKNSDNNPVAFIALWLLILGLLNLYTFLKNIIDLHGLNMEFNKQIANESNKK